MRTHLPTCASLALPAVVALLFAGCGAGQTLPGMVGDPQAPPGAGAEVPLSGAREGAVVEYFVRCTACSVAWSTPNGVQSDPAVEGSLNRRVRFRTPASGSVVSLTLTPEDGTAIREARIRVDSRVVAEGGRGALGQQVTLTAILR